ncbi:CD209 antigen-like protein B [Drosophila takahashii]|uniref:CD209 antigen-like protein B n=1 Tax=Drosophila takahashii TaxID=29030 RepID=UPI0038992345
MFKIVSYTQFLLIACNLYRSQSESLENVRSVCLLKDPPNQCGEFCLSVLEPLLNHIAKHQEQWNTSDALKLNDTQAKLGQIQTKLEEQTVSLEDSLVRLTRMEAHQTDIQKALGSQLEVQINLEKEQKSLTETFKNTIPENFDGRLERLEKNQRDMQTQQAALMDILSEVQAKILWPKFRRIGSRLFYIETQTRASWQGAVNACREMGGYIAAIKDQEELDAITKILDADRYWLGINDIASQGIYLSEASGKTAPHLQWQSGEPNNNLNNEHCVELLNGKMNDIPCHDRLYSICQADNNV